MDVVRLVEELKDSLDIHLQNMDVFLAPVFRELANAAVLARRGHGGDRELVFEAVTLAANGFELRFPRQLFVGGRFVDGSGEPIASVNPHDESVICTVESASAEDVDLAVRAAKAAFEDGEWSKISARERGALLFRCVPPSYRGPRPLLHPTR
jgi:formyltetrahydrofolate dehydrogenase